MALDDAKIKAVRHTKYTLLTYRVTLCDCMIHLAKRQQKDWTPPADLGSPAR